MELQLTIAMGVMRVEALELLLDALYQSPAGDAVLRSGNRLNDRRGGCRRLAWHAESNTQTARGRNT
jgi:hypothetical protein